MLPHEKSLVERLKDQPFALLGINSDGDAKAVKEILAREGIAWRQAIDGDTEGPWATKWNVNGWPTIYIIDAQGVIRHRDLRDEAMEKAVLALLEEAKAGE
jgi:hypothetical protein